MILSELHLASCSSRSRYHIRFRGGSSAVPFSISEANKINLMNTVDREGGDKGYRDYEVRGAARLEKQDGQQKDG